MTSFQKLPKCEAGCNALGLIDSAKGKFRKCTVCDNIVDQIYDANKEDCPHVAPRQEFVSSSAKNPGRVYEKCTACGGWMGWKDDVGNKRPRVEAAQTMATLSVCPPTSVGEPQSNDLEDIKATLASMERLLHQMSLKILVPQ